MLLPIILSLTDPVILGTECSDELCVLRSLTNGPESPKGKAAASAVAAAKPYLACIVDNLETVTWIWPEGPDAEQAQHAKWVLNTTWDVCAAQRNSATIAMADALHDQGSYASRDEELKASTRYRSGLAYVLYVRRFMKIGRLKALKAL